ncbi:unnamed protein product, partial [Sphagnum compactum]
QLQQEISSLEKSIEDLKIKSVENAYKQQLLFYENSIKSFQTKLLDTQNVIQEKEQEIESLKCIILKERENVNEMLALKDQKAKIVLDKQSSILRMCRSELETYQIKMSDLINELNEKSDIIQAEQMSLNKLKEELKMTQTSYKLQENELLKKIEELTKDYENSI